MSSRTRTFVRGRPAVMLHQEASVMLTTASQRAMQVPCTTNLCNCATYSGFAVATGSSQVQTCSAEFRCWRPRAYLCLVFLAETVVRRLPDADAVRKRGVRWSQKRELQPKSSQNHMVCHSRYAVSTTTLKIRLDDSRVLLPSERALQTVPSPSMRFSLKDAVVQDELPGWTKQS